MLSQLATDPSTGRQVVVNNFELNRKKLDSNIDKACDISLKEPDWNKNFEIFDTLNETSYLCPFAVAAIRRKLKTKLPQIEILALHVLDGMIKNVPSSHGAVAQPSFMRYLVKVGLDTRKQKKKGVIKSLAKTLSRKDIAAASDSQATTLKQNTIDKALIIIQLLYNTYEKSNTYPIFVDTYKQLIKQGVKFPENDEKASTAMGSVEQTVVRFHSDIDRSLPMIRPVTIIKNLQDYDLRVAQENARFFFEMVNASEPGSDLDSNDLILELYRSTEDWQKIVINKISDMNASEEVLNYGMTINDTINNLMEDYKCLVNHTKRRYEEAIGDIDVKSDKKNNDKNDNSNDKSDNNDNSNDKDDANNDSNDKNDEKNDQVDTNDDTSEKDKANDNGGDTNDDTNNNNDNNINDKSKDNNNDNDNDLDKDETDSKIVENMSFLDDGDDDEDDGLDMDLLALNIFDILADPSKFEQTMQDDKNQAKNETKGNDNDGNQDVPESSWAD